MKELKKSKKEQSSIKQQISSIKKELKTIQKDGVKLAASIRKKEEAIDKTNERLTELQKKRDAHQEVFSKHRDETAKLLQAMIRMQRMPKEFVIAMPGKEDTLLRTASALHVSYSGADIEMRKLASKLRELNMLENEISNQKQQLKQEKKALKEEERQLETRIVERQKLNKKLNSEQATINARIALLSRESKSLKELLGKLKEDEQLFQSMKPKAKPTGVKPPEEKKTAAFNNRKGSLQYPTSGRILHRYGQKKGPNDRFKGHVLMTGPNSKVTALHGGRVVFTGDFMDYGNMVIVEHGRNYHSLLAGFTRIDVEPGQKVLTGEPLGVMGSSDDKRKLYLELRKNSKAIDPALWMGNLSNSVAAN